MSKDIVKEDIEEFVSKYEAAFVVVDDGKKIALQFTGSRDKAIAALVLGLKQIYREYPIVKDIMENEDVEEKANILLDECLDKRVLN